MIETYGWILILAALIKRLAKKMMPHKFKATFARRMYSAYFGRPKVPFEFDHKPKQILLAISLNQN